MHRKFLLWFVPLVAVVVLLGVWVGVLLYRLHERGSATDASEYSIVYLHTGDVYYGKLHWWPKPYIDDPWYFLRDPQTGETNIVPFAATFSGPDSKMYLNMKQVVWWAALRADSQVAKGLEVAKGNINLPSGQAP